MTLPLSNSRRNTLAGGAQKDRGYQSPSDALLQPTAQIPSYRRLGCWVGFRILFYASSESTKSRDDLTHGRSELGGRCMITLLRSLAAAGSLPSLAQSPSTSAIRSKRRGGSQIVKCSRTAKPS